MKQHRTILYRTYNFTQKDPVIDEIRTLIKDTEATYRAIHEVSDVSVACLRGWFHGKTRRPQNPTVRAVVRALGYDFKIVRDVEMRPHLRKLKITMLKHERKKKRRK